MPNTKRDKYDEAADPMALPREIASGMREFISMVRDDEGGVHGWNFETENAAQWIASQLAALRSAFPPPAEAARQCAKKAILLAADANLNELDKSDPDYIDRWEALYELDKITAEIESFAQSRVEPWREALEEFEAWWRLPNIARSVETIEPAMRKCLALLSDSPAKEDTK